MVWIHPGGGFAGASDDWNPRPLVEQGIVVVTFNYRLGALGFLAHPALTAESRHAASGNYGLMDQQAVLRWVRENIARFGGDPDNVTIFGHSAGGYAVRAQLASPMAAGLFHKAIIQTGTWAFRPLQERSPGFPGRVTDAPLEVAESRGAAFATAAGCPDQTAACLRSVSVEAVLANQPSVDVTVDGRVLTEPITAAIARGAFNRVPVIEGVAHDEWRLFVAFDELVSGPLTMAGYAPAIAATLDVSPAGVSSIVARYPVDAGASPAVPLGAVGTDAALACPTVAEVDQLARWVPTFMYEFNDVDAPPPPFLPSVSFPYGAFHGAELPYLFSAGSSSALDVDQQELAGTMVRYWTNFASTGRPSASDTPPWPRHSPATGRFQSLTAPTPETATGFLADHECRFWTSLAP
jgi:para-nitrobenzyl esterase